MDAKYVKINSLLLNICRPNLKIQNFGHCLTYKNIFEENYFSKVDLYI
jgi:hypothetical protein